MPTDSKQPTIQVKVYSPRQTFFEDEALSLSAVNDTGPFDVLPKHHNFMTLVNPCLVKIQKPDKHVISLQIDQGVLHVRQNQVTLFLDV